MYYINYFFLYSIIGHLIESVIYLFCSGKSGVLYGFWTPVYGIGIIIILLINKFLNRLKIDKIKHYIYLFFISSILLSLSELIGGICIEKIFHKEMWNYEDQLFNIGKYISLEMALIWGTSSIIFIKFFKKISDKIIKKIPKILTIILIILFILDILLTLINKT